MESQGSQNRPLPPPLASHCLVVAIAVAGLAIGSAASASAQQTGRIVGRVISAESGAPISEAQVFLPGTQLGGLTRQNGTFVILEAPVGTHEIRVERIGLSAVSEQVTVTAGEAVEANFQMTTEALGLDEIVVTGTAGAARRREVGSTIAQISVADLPARPVETVQLLQASTPGMLVTPTSGALGGGFSIRLRGTTTVSMSNQPIVYVDGVRMQSRPFPGGRASGAPGAGSSGNGGGVEANPLNFINQNDIERIEVIKGSAATTLYGTEASAGVIQIFTKKGASGAPVWSLETQQSLLRSLKIGTALFPFHRFDPYLRTGHVGEYTASVRGGAQTLQYFASLNYKDAVGILPQDTLNQKTFRGNFTFTPRPSLQVQLNNGYALTWQRNTPQGGNASGLTHNALRGQGNYFQTEDPAVVSQVFTQDYQQRVERFTTGGTVTYSPLATLTNRMTVGYDFSEQEVRGIRPFGFVFFTPGSIYNDTWGNRLLTVDYVGTFSLDLTEGLRSSFSWGGQAVGEDQRRVNTYGEGFPGASNPTVSSASKNAGLEDRSKVWNAGFFGQNVFDIHNRYFVTVGLRVDGNSAFGSGFGLQAYPKASVSWVMSDEAFWPEAWGSVKLRAAYGQSGRAPGAFDAAKTWVSQPFGGQSALVPSNVGDANIGPEVTAEFETGFDADFADGRITATFTYYNQTTSDALFDVLQIPTLGFGGSQRTNVGKLRNQGMELSVEGSPVRTADFGWDVGLNISTNKSEALDLGGLPPFVVSGGWIIEGQPVPVLRGRWVRNGDRPGVPVPCTSAAAQADPTLPCIEQDHLYGQAQPSLTLAPSTSVRLPGGISLSARGEFRGGQYVRQSNFTSGGVSRSAWMPECWPHYVNPYDGTRQTPAYARPTKEHTLALRPDTPGEWVAKCTPAMTNDEYFTHKGDYFKLRSVSAQIPLTFIERVNQAVLTLSMNNAWRWLNDDWLVGDPEMGANTADGLLSTGPASVPPPTWTMNASLRLQF